MGGPKKGGKVSPKAIAKAASKATAPVVVGDPTSGLKALTASYATLFREFNQNEKALKEVRAENLVNQGRIVRLNQVFE